MRFWRRKREIRDDIKTILTLLLKQVSYTAEFANDNPIKTVNNKPLVLVKTLLTRRRLIIQNIGLEPCYIKLDKEINKDNFHFVLAPDTSPAFGNGGSITLDDWQGGVYAICENETKLSVLEY